MPTLCLGLNYAECPFSGKGCEEECLLDLEHLERGEE